MPSDKKNNWYHIFTAGTYLFEDEKEVTITPEDLSQIAQNYNAEMYEADLHVGHPDFTKEPEPAALGWIGALKAEGDKLYCSFSHLSAKAKEYVNDKLYRWCSIEFATIKGIGRYLVGLGLTNYPKVDDLPELQFSDFKKFNDEVQLVEMFSEKINSIKYIMPKENKNSAEVKFSPEVEKFSTRVGINISEYNCDGDVLEFAAAQIEELRAMYAGDENLKSLSMFVEKWKALPGEIETLKASNTELQSKLDDTVKASEVEKIVASAVAEGKILPSQRETFVAFGALGGPEKLKEEVSKLVKLDVFKQDVVKDAPIEVAKSEIKTPDGKPVTLAMYCKAVGSSKPEDVAIVASVKEEDVKNLPGYDDVTVINAKRK